MENLPVYISIVFILTTLLTAYIFYKAANNSKTVFIVLVAWLALQTLIGLSGFYKLTSTIPPRFVLLVIPPLLLIVVLFFSVAGKRFLDNLNLKTLTILHVIRIPVELVLYWLFIQKTIPGLMTFEGRNFDILSGITAPFIWYFGFVKKRISNNLIVLWNFICLGLLINIVINAILSSPFAFQQFAFDQPNIAILYFPFIWLPCCIVPIVLLSHLASIRRLLNLRSLPVEARI